MSLSLKTNNRHRCEPGGFRASLGSEYLRTTPFVVFDAAARRPVVLKFASSLSFGGSRAPDSEAEATARRASRSSGVVEDGRPLDISFESLASTLGFST